MRSEKMIYISWDHFYLVQAKLSSLFIYFTYLAFCSFLHMLNCFTDPVYGVTTPH